MQIAVLDLASGSSDGYPSDWIHDSILERNRRLRSEREIAINVHGANGEITKSWAWAHWLKLMAAGQSWFVVSLAGTLNRQGFLLAHIAHGRLVHWRERCPHLHTHGMAV